MSGQTLAEIQKSGISVADALAIFGVAMREGRTLDAVLVEWRSKYYAESVVGCKTEMQA